MEPALINEIRQITQDVPNTPKKPHMYDLTALKKRYLDLADRMDQANMAENSKPGDQPDAPGDDQTQG